MARRYLGDTFDIHGGGLDLRFPHHENEQAQSRAAGLGFARYWLHNGWVTQSGAKMSKSLGNGLLVTEVLDADPSGRAALRPGRGALPVDARVDRRHAAPRPRRPGTGSRGSCSAPSSGSAPVADDEVREAELPADFVAAMDDDLNVPAALAVVHERLRAGNSALAAGDLAAARDRAGRAAGHAGRARARPRRDPSGRRAPATPGQPRRSTRSCATGWPRARRPARPATSPPPTRSGTACGRRRRRRGLTGRGAMVAGHHPGGTGLMAGNSQRRGATRKAGSKKGARVGSGGQGRQALEGRGPTPKATERRTTRPASAPPPPRSARRSPAPAAPAAPPRPARRGPRAARAARRAVSATHEIVAGRNSVRRGAARRHPGEHGLLRRPAWRPTTAPARSSPR